MRNIEVVRILYNVSNVNYKINSHGTVISALLALLENLMEEAVTEKRT